MQWNDFCFCVAAMSVAGSIGCILFLLIQKVLRLVRLELAAIKTVIVLFLFPIVYPLLCFSRLRLIGGEWVMINLFGSHMPKAAEMVFGIVSLIWFIGLVVGVSIRAYQYTRFQKVINQSIPVKDSIWESLIENYAKRYLLKQIPIYQNERLNSPIVVGVIRPMIILPNRAFDMKQKHMIAEHELHHIHNKDLLWKKIAMWVTWLHWYNPLSYWLFNRLILEEEIACDLAVCDANPNYTVKEYGMFLYEAEAARVQHIFGSALFETKKELMRRIIAMTKRKSMRKLSTRLAALCCGVLMFCSVTPAYAMGETVAALDENWRASIESPAEMNETVTMVNAVLDTGAENEVYVEDGVATYSSIINVDYPIAGNSRYYYRSEDLEVGDKVSIMIRCDNPDATFMIGIKNEETSVLYYLQGTEVLSYTFTITEAGPYRAVVENKSSELANFQGIIMYPEN